MCGKVRTLHFLDTRCQVNDITTELRKLEVLSLTDLAAGKSLYITE